MDICSTQQMKELESSLIEMGKSAECLMNEAAENIVREISENHPGIHQCIAFVGKGNNGGDAVAILRLLRKKGWKIFIRSPFPKEEWSPLLKKQFETIDCNGIILTMPPEIEASVKTILLDGLLGLGAKGEMSHSVAEYCMELNSIRQEKHQCRTWSIDIPTGLDGDEGNASRHTIIADFTASIGTIKQGLIHDNATAYAGRIIPVPLTNLEKLPSDKTKGQIIDRCDLRKILPPRHYEFFKNKAGHVGIIAGSIGMTGAARLCSEAALRSGAGLVTLFVPDDLYPIIAPSVIPEIMVTPIKNYGEIQFAKFDSLLIGPGLGYPERKNIGALHQILENYRGCITLDADGLNLAAREKWILRENVLATPHTGEMKRLLEASNISSEGQSRLQMAKSFSCIHDATLIFKGARSIISSKNHPIHYNSTGGPSMATAGQGDVLAGVCAGICAQGLSVFDAAVLGTYLCGRSSDLLINTGKQTEQTLLAGDTLRGLHSAFLEL